jgi:hypothetical protein
MWQLLPRSVPAHAISHPNESSIVSIGEPLLSNPCLKIIAFQSNDTTSSPFAFAG